MSCRLNVRGLDVMSSENPVVQMPCGVNAVWFVWCQWVLVCYTVSLLLRIHDSMAVAAAGPTS